MQFKKFIIVFLLPFLFLIACSTGSALNINQSEIEYIEITFFKEFAERNTEHYKTIRKSEDIKIFIDAINTSKPINGDVDMPKGDYNLELKFKNGTVDVFHLWIPKDNNPYGTLINKENTAEAYQINKKITEQIRTIVLK